MRTKNYVSLIGIVGKDAEVRTTQGGVKYARFSLATSTGGYKKQDGTEVPEVTQWHSIVCWRNLAEAAGQLIKKGMKVDIEGMITYGDYTDKDGAKRYTCEIMANDFVLMMKSGGGKPEPQEPVMQNVVSPRPQAQVQPQPQPQGGVQQDPAEILPF